MTTPMNGAESLVRTLVAGDVTVSFTNPGTSEMHFVAALDRVDGMRCVLCLHETVATGAADAYFRMKDSPASTLLHLGPGLANGLANLHNLKRARTGVVNIVGEHATYHIHHDAPLTSDIEGIAGTMSKWVRTSISAQAVAKDGADAIVAARQHPGQIATLILPADTAWNDGSGPVAVPAVSAPDRVSDAAVEAAAKAIEAGGRPLILLGTRAVRAKATEYVARIAAKTGAKVLAETSNGRIARGAGRYAIERLPYPVDAALAATAGITHLILVGAKAPVAFFAYPNKPSLLYPENAEVVELAAFSEDQEDALARLAERLGADKTTPVLSSPSRPARPSGALNSDAIAKVIGHLLPDNCIVTDESVTTGRNFFKDTHGAPQHDWLSLTGGAIGDGLPLAVGAAVACPDRKVIALQADGSGMYSVQALWTMARERLDVVVCVWANSAYAILKGELANVGAQNPGRKAHDMLSLADPDIDWVQLAGGLGIEARKVETAEAFADVFAAAVSRKGPFLIQVTF